METSTQDNKQSQKQVENTKGTSAQLGCLGLSKFQQVLQTIKHIISLILTVFAIIIIFLGISQSHASLEGHPVLHLFILLFCLVLLGYLEGLQVAILALENMDVASFKQTHKRAFQLHKIVTNGNNVQKFLVGRQFFVVFVVFLIAQVTTYPSLPKMGMPDWLFTILISTGLPGVMIVLSFGQLMPQLIASTHPVTFMNIIGCKYIVYLTLALDWLGITHFSWLLTYLVKKFVCCLKTDSDHILTIDATNKSDKYEEKDIEVQKNQRKQSSINEDYEKAQNWLFTYQNSKGSIETDISESNYPVENKQNVNIIKDLDLPLKGYTPTPQADKFPMPGQIAKDMLQQGKGVPRFLLPPKHKDHIPPHIIACTLLNILDQEYGNIENNISNKKEKTNINKTKSQ